MRQLAKLLFHVCLGVFQVLFCVQALSVNFLFRHLALLDICLDGLILLLFILVRLFLSSSLRLGVQMLIAMFEQARRRLVAPSAR